MSDYATTINAMMRDRLREAELSGIPSPFRSLDGKHPVSWLEWYKILGYREPRKDAAIRLAQTAPSMALNAITSLPACFKRFLCKVNNR